MKKNLQRQPNPMRISSKVSRRRNRNNSGGVGGRRALSKERKKEFSEVEVAKVVDTLGKEGEGKGRGG